MKFNFYCLLFITINIVFCQDINNEWTDPITNTYYNYNGLQKEINSPWTIRKESGVFADVYKFNFGIKIDTICHKRFGNVIETMEVYDKPTPTCSIFGFSEYRQVKLINQENNYEGIIVTYENGDRCNSISTHNSVLRSTNFYLYCSSVQDENV